MLYDDIEKQISVNASALKPVDSEFMIVSLWPHRFANRFVAEALKGTLTQRAPYIREYQIMIIEKNIYMHIYIYTHKIGSKSGLSQVSVRSQSGLQSGLSQVL